MNQIQPRPRRSKMYTAALLVLATLAAAQPSFADDQAASATAAPKETVTEELIRLLAEHNALSKDDAAKLIQRLQTEQGQAAAPAAAAPPPAAAAAQPQGEPKGRVRVIYLPDSEKEKIRKEVKDEVIATAKQENWALPNTFPEWVKHIRMDGDLRLRQEFDLYDSTNNPFIIDFNSINTGAPFNVGEAATNQTLPPLLDTTTDREYPRVSLHLGLGATIADDLESYVRFATGNNNNPVSTNQTLGTDFNKYSFVVDRAYLAYKPLRDVDLQVLGGRMPNPFQGTQMMWYYDLGFDGFAASYHYHPSDTFTPYATLGAFSVENTALNFPSTYSEKVGSRDKWLFAAQLGAEWKRRGMAGKFGLGYYDYYHLEGSVSDPCQAPTTAFSCSSDDSRAGFVQKGNTMFAIRDLLIQQPTDPQYQFFGLASPFRILDAVIKLDYALRGPVHFIFDGDFATNMAFKRQQVLNLPGGPVNNFGPCTPASGQTTCQGPYVGGRQAYLVQGRFGYPVIAERGDWSLQFGYRRVESDAVVDAFNDPDFYIGGTNNKGYHLIGNLGFTHNAWLSARWFSGTEVSGPPLSIDVVQIDVNSRW
jgi:hypothetical protein